MSTTAPTYTVTNTNASGEGSLAWAIAQANAYTGEGTPTISFDPALAGQEIALAAELSLTRAARLINLAENPVVLTTYGLRTSAALHLENMRLPWLRLTTATTLSGSGNVFTGDDSVLYLSSLDVDLSGFSGTATGENPRILLNRMGVNHEVCLRVLGEGLSIYSMSNAVTVGEGGVLRLEEGVTLRGDDGFSYLRVTSGGCLTAEHARLEFGGYYHTNTNGSSTARIDVEEGARLALNDTTIVGWVNGGCEVTVRSGALVMMENCRSEQLTNFTAESGSTMELSGTTLQYLTSGGTLSMDDCTVETSLRLNAGAVLSGTATFTGDWSVMHLSTLDVDLSGFSGKATSENAYILLDSTGVSREVSLRALGEGLSTYSMPRAVTVGEGGILRLEEGVTLRGDDGRSVLSIASGGRFEAEQARLEFGGYYSTYSGNYYACIELQEGAEALLKDSVVVGRLNGNNCRLTVASGARLTMENCRTEQLTNFTAENGSTLELRNTSLQSLSCHGSLNMDSCMIQGNLMLYSGASLRGSANTFTNTLTASSGSCASLFATTLDGGTLTLQRGSTAELMLCSGSGRLNIASGVAANIHGNNFSEISVYVSSAQEGDAPIDLSGNYWGVSTKEEILAKIGGDTSNVVINDWVMVDPTQEFVYVGTSLHNQRIGKGVTGFDIHLTHDIDASTVSRQTVRLLDNRGNEVELTGLEVDGKNIRVNFDALGREGEYRLVLGEGIRNIVGDPLVALTENPYTALLKADFVAPRVSHLEPGGDFVGTLSELKIYFTDAVDITTLKAGISILNPTGQKVQITQVRDLGGNVYALEVAPQTAYGAYSVTVGTEVMDMAGNRLNQNGNDTPGEEVGDSFVGGFAIADVDLTISDVLVASSLASGEAVTVTWAGENATGYALMGSWTDGVYLSRDAVWDIGDTLLGNYAHGGGLAEGASYEGSLSFSMPGVVPGDYYLLVRSDMYGQEQTNKEPAELAQNLKAVSISLSMPELTLGETAGGNMSKGDNSDYFHMRQEPGKSLQLTLSSSVPEANMEIFIGYGRVPTRESYDLALQPGKGDGSLIIPSREGGGDVYVLVNNKSTGMETSYQIMAEVIPMTVTSITPTTQGRESSATFDIYGVNFTQNTSVVFIDAEGKEYRPDYLEVISSERIRIRYDAKRLPVGKLDVVVQSESDTVRCDDIIDITISWGAHLKITPTYPDVLGYHVASKLGVHYANTGTDPMHAPLLTFTVKQNGKEGAILTMDSSIVNQGFWTDAMPEGFSTSVSFLAYSSGTPGRLMPTGVDHKITSYLSRHSFGDSPVYLMVLMLWNRLEATQVHSGDGYQVSLISGNRDVFSSDVYAENLNGGNVDDTDLWLYNVVNEFAQSGNTTYFYYCGWQQPWDYGYPPFNFEIGYLGTDNTSPLNWYDSFSYTDMAPELKQALANSLTASAGNTWGDYVLMLNENLIYLDELGSIEAGSNMSADTDSFVSFELMKANGTLTPVKELSSSTDAAVSAPGLSLAISRAFKSDISSRFEEGAFGYGWSFNWDIDLSFRDDGTVELNTPSAQYVYQPDWRGGYINASGDQGTFKKNKDGSYTLREPDGMVMQFAADGKLLSETDANGNRITCTYDEETGLLTRLTHSNGSYIALAWDESGHIIRVEDSQGDTVDYAYERGHLISATNQHGESVQYAYSSEFAHALTRVTGTDGISTDFSYNHSGLLQDSSQTSADEQASGYGKVTLSYGDNGEVTVTDVYGATSTYYYDNKGQVRRAVDANGNTVRYGYDAKGNVTWFTDQSGNTSSYIYDAAGNMTSATNALGHTTTYTYTKTNALDILTDALGHNIDYDYDERGNMTRITYADGSYESWTYDALGNADSWTNRRGHTVSSEYDQHGRVTSRHYEDGSSATFAYDAHGNVLSMSDSTGTTAYTYREKSELLSLTRSNGQGLAFTYDDAGRRSTMTDSEGNVTRYAYTAFGLLERVTEQKAGETEEGLLVEYSYDQGGRLVHEEQGNGNTTDYSYTLAGQVERQTTRNAAGEVLQFCAYTYDAVGLRTSMETQDGTWTYSYDKIGQLTRAIFTPAAGSSLSAQDYAYSYDAAGNRTKTVINGLETVCETNNLNQTTTAGDVSYTYDADGNMLSKTDASGVTLYAWDDDNQLIRVQMSTGEVYSYTYNAAGERVSVTHNGETTEYLYDPAGYGNLVAEYNAITGEQEKTYSHGNGLIGFEEAFGGEYWYQGDALGSVTGITDGSGNLVATYSYDPYGNSLSSTGSLDNAFQWVGLWSLSAEETGLTHMRARYYDPETGKFISADPIGIAGGENLYAYCVNNSLNLIDPSGTASQYIGPGEQASILGDWDSYGFSSISEAGDYIREQNTKALSHIAGTASKINKQSKMLAPFLGRVSPHSVKLMKPGKVKHDSLMDNHEMVPLFDWDINGISREEHIQKWLEEQYGEQSTLLDSGDSDNLASHDPNDLVGPEGYGEQGYIAPMDSMSFMLRFENDKEATAPTRWMRMYNEFDESYDLDSFTLGSFCLAGNLIEMQPGQDSFNQKLTMNFNGQDMLVEVKINMNREERRLEAEFTAIDPETGWMIQDPTVGMLYPNDESGRGDGYITYSIETRDDLENGASFSNQADIYFDFNEVIPTPELTYTIDAAGPSSRMLSAVDTGENGEALLTWEGTDAESGIGGYLVFVQRDGGDFAYWQTFDAETTTATFAGEESGLYGFYVVAVDNVGNIETEKKVAEVEVTLTSTDRTAPGAVGSLAGYIDGSEALVSWTPVDDPSGVFYRVEYVRGGHWFAATSQLTSLPMALMSGLREGEWSWRVQAIDGLGNAGEWTEGEAFRIDITVPALPAGLAVAVAGQGASLRWEAVADAGGVAYELRYRLHGAAEYTTATLAEPGYELTGLAAGDTCYEWSVRAVDAVGNASAWVEGASFLVGGAAETLRLTSAPQLASGGKGKVKASLAWEGEEGARYTLAVDGKAVVKNKKGKLNWSGTLKGEEHVYELTMTTAEGHSSTLAGSFRLDTTAPTLKLAAPELAKAGEGQVVATFGWSGHEEGLVYTIMVDKDKEPLYRGTDATPTLVLADGKHSYTVTATDALGNSQTVKGSFNFDATAPTLTLNTYKTKLAKDGTVAATLSWKGESGCTYVLVLDGEEIDMAKKTSYKLALAADEAKEYYVIARDKAGNTAVSETRTARFDSTKPVLGELGASMAADGVASFSWDCTDGNGVTYTIKVDGKTIKDAVITAGADGRMSYTHATPLKGGKHSYEVTATDWAGNKQTAKGAAFTTPKLSVSKPKLSKAGEGEVAALLSWKGDAAASYTLTVDGKALAGGITEGKPGAYSYHGRFADGAHDYCVTATDASGKLFTVVAGSFDFDATAPGIILGALSGVVDKKGRVKVTLNWSGEDGVKYTLKAGKKGVYSGKALTKAYTFEEGGHELVITAKDKAGNVYETTATLKVAVVDGAAQLAWVGTGGDWLPAQAQELAWQGAESEGVCAGWSAEGTSGCYRFTLDSARQLVLGLDGLEGDARVTLQQEGGLGSIELSAHAGTGLDRELSLSAGTYYLQVSPTGEGALGDYRLDLELEANGKKAAFAQATLASLA